MKTFTQAIAIALLSLPLLASAGNRAATSTMQVSFVVTESCSVQTSTSATAAKTPAVNCQLQTPYQMTRSNEKAATAVSSSDNTPALRQESAPQEWTITF